MQIIPYRLFFYGLILIAVLAAGAALALLPLRWLAIGVPGLVAIGVMFLKPELALYSLAFAIPFGSLYEINLGGVTVGAAEGLIGLSIMAWAVHAIAFREPRWTWPRLSIFLLLFIGAALFSLLNTTDIRFSIKELLKWVEFLGMMLFVCNATSVKQSRILVACLLLAGTAQAAIGVYQFLTQSGPPSFILMGRFMRAFGTFEQPNPYAGYLGLTASLALALSFVLAEKQKEAFRSSWLYWLALGSLGALVMAIGMSWSRGAWMSFAAAFITVNLARSRRGALVFVALVVLVAFLGLLGSFKLLPEAVVQRMVSFLPFANVQDVRSVEVTDENYAVLERLAHWQAALGMWGDHLWLGVGFGNYQIVYARYALPKWDLPLGHAHNYYLNIAAETGLLGLGAYLALWSAAFWQAIQAIRCAGTRYAKALALGALGMLVHVSVHNLIDNLWVHNLYIQVALVLGIVEVNLQDFRRNARIQASHHTV